MKKATIQAKIACLVTFRNGADNGARTRRQWLIHGKNSDYFCKIIAFIFILICEARRFVCRKNGYYLFVCPLSAGSVGVDF